MEITEKDFELIDNYLDGTLSREEYALFKIRMQDEEFAGFLKFQQNLKEEFAENDRQFFYQPIPSPKKDGTFSPEFLAKLTFVGLITIILSIFTLFLLR